MSPYENVTFKCNGNIHEKKDLSRYVVLSNKASFVTLQ